jgi:Ca2+-binding RTX toxin-like protein
MGAALTEGELMIKQFKAVGVGGAALVAAMSGAVIGAGPADAVTPHPTELTFTSDTAGGKPAGFTSVDSPNISFQGTTGSIQIGDFDVQSRGNAIVSFGASGGLQIDLTEPTNSIAMAFGNDDPAFATNTSKARLDVFRGATQVGSKSVNFNANDVMDQTIRYGDKRLFDRAVLTYVDPSDTPLSLAEVVDDIKVAPLCTKAGNSGNNVIVGTSGKDVLCGDSGSDVIKGAGSGDIVFSGPGNDTVDSGDGSDWVSAGDGRDKVDGGNGSDVLRGEGGRDKLAGAQGGDILSGGSSHDKCDGGPQHDTGQSCEVRVSLP